MANRDDMMQDLVYGDMITTPGYDVEFAVGTTYSMNMKALLIVPYSLVMFGDLGSNVKSCQKILVCCDQGPTMEIFDRMNMKADALLEYSKSRKYNEDQTYMDSVEDWKDYERQIDFQDYFDDKLKLDDNDFVSVVYDNVEY